MKYFKTDGIRGIFKRDDLSIDLILRVGSSMKIFKEKRVLLAYDTRYSSNIIKELLKYSIRLSGCDVIDLGMGSTPYLMFCSLKYKLPAIMITASHNDFTYNGLKIIYKGKKINEAYQERIEMQIDNEPIRGPKIGKYCSKILKNKYIAYLNKFKCDNRIKVCFDLANGSMCFLEDYLKKRFCNSIIIANEPNGTNINQECGSLYPDKLRKATLDNECEIGFSFDGDGDRIIVCDKFGKIYNGDMLLAFVALAYKREAKLKGNNVICTKIANPGIMNYLKKKGINVKAVDVGDYNITKEINDIGGIGGEKSGHLLIEPKLCYSDAIVSALIILRLYQKHGFKIMDNIVPYYEKSENAYDIKNPIAVEKRLSDIVKNGIVIIRKSGTENLYRILLMSKVEKEIEEASKALKEIIE